MAIVALAGLWLAWVAVGVMATAEHVRRQRFAAALALDPGSAEALSGIAAERLDAKDYSRAETAARAAVARAPLSAAAARLLASAREMQGDRAGATAIMNQARRLGWRDGEMQFHLLGAAMAAGALDDAAARLDALARQDIDRPVVFALIDATAIYPRFRSALARRLALRPDWRQVFLRSPPPLDVQGIATRDALLRAIAATPAPPTRAEVAPYFWALGRLGEVGHARRLWAALGHAGGDAALSDGAFDRPLAADDRLVFDWALRSSASGAATIAPHGGGGNHALHVVTDGSGGGALVSQLLALPPGAHRFAVDVAGDAAARDSARWSIACSGRAAILTGGRSEAGSGDLRRSRIDFVVPEGCPSQRLELRAGQLPEPGGLEIWFDNAAIDGR